MGRAPCCEKNGLKKGPWTQEEDKKLVDYIERHGHGSWRALPGRAGLMRCGKSCRLRWTNYLRPDIKRGKFSPQEEQTIINLHAVLGNKWSAIASHLPGRTDNEIKNTWNTHLKKRLLQMGIDPVTHRPITDLMDCSNMSYFSDPTLGHIAQWENALRLEAERRIIMREYLRQAALAEHGITASDLLMRRPDDSFGIDINSVAHPTWASQQAYNGISLDYNGGLPQYSLLEQLVQQEQRNRNDSLNLGNQSNDSSLNQNQGCNINMFSDGICSLALGSSSSTPLTQMDPSVQHLSHNTSTISSIDHYNVSNNLLSPEPALMSASENAFSKNLRGNFVPEMNSSSSMINSMNCRGPEFPSEFQIDTKAKTGSSKTGSSTFSDLKHEDGKDYWCNMLKLVGIVSPGHQVEASDGEQSPSANPQRIGSHGRLNKLLDIIHDDLIMFEEPNELRNQVEIIRTTTPDDFKDRRLNEAYE